MNTIILEHPRLRSDSHFNDIANTPLWSCLLGGYAASLLKENGHDVTYLDCPGRGLSFAETTTAICDQSADLLAINAVYFWEGTDALFTMLKELRQDGFAGHINLFGFFPSLHSKVILDHCPEVDSIALGECEQTLVELADALSNSAPWQDIAGLGHHTSTSSDPRTPCTNLDKLPFPTRFTKGVTTPAILASRGCYNHCSFCPIPSFYNQGPLWRGRSPQNVVAEIEALHEQGFGDFYFVDPNFIGPGKAGRERTLELLRLLEPLEITFGMETRPNDLDEEMMDMLSRAGLTSLLLGIESGSGQGLENLDKHCSVNVSEQALTLCRSKGIEPEVGFLMFTPETSLGDLAENLAFLERNQLLDRLERTANLLCHRQIILGGTKGYQRYQQQGSLTPTGPMGFEGDVAFADPGVAWTSQVMIPLCLWLLRLTGDQSSPLFFESAGNYQRFNKVNDHLVTCFAQAVESAGQPNRPEPEALLQSMTAELEELIKTSPLIATL